MSFASSAGNAGASQSATYTHPANSTTEQTILTLGTFNDPKMFSAEFDTTQLTTNNCRLREYRSRDGVTFIPSRSVTFNGTGLAACQVFAPDLSGWQLRYTLQTGMEAASRTISYRINFV